jgi:hypothetical protein
MARRSDVDHPPRRQVDDEERVDLAEQEVVGLDEVAGPHPFGVVLHEGRPALATAALAANPAHVLLDRSLADLDPELERLAADALGAPQPSPRRHVADQVDGFAWQRRRLSRPGSAPPEAAKAGAMPTQNGLGLNEGDRSTPRRQPPRTEE